MRHKQVDLNLAERTLQKKKTMAPVLCLVAALAVVANGFVFPPKPAPVAAHEGSVEPWAAPDFPWYNWSLPVQQRVAALVAAMTVSEKAAQLNNGAPAIPHLAVPAYDYWNEAAHGVAWAGKATVFPASIGMAASFDVDAVHRAG